jgi:hypothetical protein
MVLFLRGLLIVYRKLDKPCLFRVEDSFLAHKGKDLWYSFGLDLGDALKFSANKLNHGWVGSGVQEKFFEGGAVVAPSPIILWRE